VVRNDSLISLTGGVALVVAKMNGSNITPLQRCWSGDATIRSSTYLWGIPPDKPNIRGVTPLWRASHSGRKEVVQVLLTTNAVDVNAWSTARQTPLFWAAAHGHSTVVQLLLDHGAEQKLHGRGLQITALHRSIFTVRAVTSEAQTKKSMRIFLYPHRPLSWFRTVSFSWSERL